MSKTSFKYIVRYTAEIGTKHRQVRWRYINRLAKNIREAIRLQFGEGVQQKSTVDQRWSYTLVESPEDLSEVLSRISGIQHFSPVTIIKSIDFESLVEQAHQRFAEKVKELDTYGVRCRIREDTDYKRRDVEQEVGALLNDKGEVDLDNADVFCYIEVRDGKAFLYDEKIPGIKGVPLGVQKKSLTLLSGGIDSPVAVWLAFRMGMDQDFIYFDLGGKEQKENIFRVYRELMKKWGAGATSKLIVIDFLPVIQEIMSVKKPYQNLVLKYFFYKTAEQLADDDIQSLITGESVGQVSTQTVPNLAALDQMTSLLLVRPLTAYPKEEIVSLAREIGTFDIAYKGKEYCALATKNVVTASTYERLRDVVEPLDTTVIDRVLQNKEVYQLDQTGELQQLTSSDKTEKQPSQKDQSFSQKVKAADRVIDLRSKEDFEKAPIEVAENIPFDKAWNDYIHWDPDSRYLLVCEVGSRSKMLAHYMEEEDFQVEHLKGGVSQLSESELSTLEK